MELALPPSFKGTLASAPLALVACQLKFSEPKKEITAARVADFRNMLVAAKFAYPKVSELKIQSVTLNLAAGGPTAGESSTGWRLTSADGRWNATFTKDALTLETTRYRSWADEFAPRMHALIKAFATEFRPSVESRLGLRYVDLISGGNVRSVSDWRGILSDTLLGPSLDETIAPGILVANQQFTLAIDEEIRCVVRHGPFPDPARDNAFSYVLDTDVFRESFLPFRLEDVEAALEKLHDVALSLFTHFVSESYRQSLRGPAVANA